MPNRLWMLVGVPGSGKTTWRKKFTGHRARVSVTASTDDVIEERALLRGTTYSEIFEAEIGSATKLMHATVRDAIDMGIDVYWDQTNLTIKSRARKLALFPEDWPRHAFFFPTPPEDVLRRRLEAREGKEIPWSVVSGMISRLEPPTTSEGFEQVHVVSGYDGSRGRRTSSTATGGSPPSGRPSSSAGPAGPPLRGRTTR